MSIIFLTTCRNQHLISELRADKISEDLLKKIGKLVKETVSIRLDSKALRQAVKRYDLKKDNKGGNQKRLLSELLAETSKVGTDFMTPPDVGEETLITRILVELDKGKQRPRDLKHVRKSLQQSNIRARETQIPDIESLTASLLFGSDYANAPNILSTDQLAIFHRDGGCLVTWLRQNTGMFLISGKPGSGNIVLCVF